LAHITDIASSLIPHCLVTKREGYDDVQDSEVCTFP